MKNQPGKVFILFWIILLGHHLHSQTIAVATIGTSPYCQGSSLQLEVTLAGSFTTSNIIQAQLSDLEGRFDQYLILGSRKVNTSAALAINLPSSIRTGTYQIRVISTAPSVTSNIIPIVINGTAISQDSFGNQQWRVAVYRNVNWTGYSGNYISMNTGLKVDTKLDYGVNSPASSAPGYTGCIVNAASQSVSYKRKGFPCGYYSIQIDNHDDYVRVLIDGQEVFSFNGCCKTHPNIWRGLLNENSKVEFRLNNQGGGGNEAVFQVVRLWNNYDFVTTGPGSTVCHGGEAILKAGGATQYQWFANGSLIGVDSVLRVYPEKTLSYMVVGQLLQCVRDTQWVEVQVAIDFNLQVTTSSRQFLCAETASPILTAQGASNYQWSLQRNFSTIASTNFRFTPLPRDTTKYYVKGSNGCLEKMDSITIFVAEQAPGNPSAWGNQRWSVFAYNGDSLNQYRGYYGSASLDINTQSQWTNNLSPSRAPGYQGCPVDIDHHSYRYKRKGFTCGWYRMDVIAHDHDMIVYLNGKLLFEHKGCCDSHMDAWNGFLDEDDEMEVFCSDMGNTTSRLIVNFVLLSPIEFNQLPAKITVCPGTSATLQCRGPGTSFEWSASPILNQFTERSVTASPSDSVRLYVIAKGCGQLIDVDTIDLLVNVQPQTKVTPEQVTICPGESAVLTVSGAYTYHWYTANGLQAIQQSNYQITVTPNSTTTYRVNGFNNCTNAIASAQVTISTPQLQIEPGNKSWNVFAYTGKSLDLLNIIYKGYYPAIGLNFDNTTAWNPLLNPSVANGYKGCVVADDQHTVRAIRKGFEPGFYTISLLHDDEVRLYINEIQAYQNLGCCTWKNNVWTGYLGSNSIVELRWADQSSNSIGKLVFQKIANPDPTGTFWIGETDSDWFNPANWTDGVPTQYSKVTVEAISTYDPYLDKSASVMDLFIANGASVSLSRNNSLFIHGDFSLFGQFLTDNGRLVFCGNKNQQLNAGALFSLPKLEINQPARYRLTLNRSIEVTDELVLGKGLLVTSLTFRLYLGSDATVTGASSNSYVEGPMTKYGTSDFVFPVGKNGKLSSIGIHELKRSARTETAFTAEYFPVSYPLAYEDSTRYSGNPGNLFQTSTQEYWRLTRDAGTATPLVSLYWESMYSKVDQLAKPVVAGFIGMVNGKSTWQNGDKRTMTGSAGKGSILSNRPFSSYNIFTLGSTDKVEAIFLPAKLVLFNALPGKASITLTWAAEDESGLANYALEYSIDGQSFQTLAVFDPGSKSYSWIHEPPKAGIHYYRLRMTGSDGTIQYSKIITATLQTSFADLKAWPIPAQHSLHLQWDHQGSPQTVQVISSDGKIVMNLDPSPGENLIAVDHLPKGCYFVRVVYSNAVKILPIQIE